MSDDTGTTARPMRGTPVTIQRATDPSHNIKTFVWVHQPVRIDAQNRSSCTGCAFNSESARFCHDLVGSEFEGCIDLIAIEDTPEAKAAYVRLRLTTFETRAGMQDEFRKLGQASFGTYPYAEIAQD